MEAEYYYLIAAIVSFGALVVSLIVSSVSLRKVHKQIQISNLREYSKSYREIWQRLPLEMFEEEMLDDFEFDRDQTKAVCIYFGLLYEEFRLHKDGSIDKKSWTDWENNLNRHARTPGFLKAWDITNQFFDFDDEFASFINKKIPKVRGNSR